MMRLTFLCIITAQSFVSEVSTSFIKKEFGTGHIQALSKTLFLVLPRAFGSGLGGWGGGGEDSVEKALIKVFYY